MITFSGRVRLRPGAAWMPFHATETIRAGASFHVTARARRGPFRATVEDVYTADGATGGGDCGAGLSEGFVEEGPTGHEHAVSRVRAFGFLPLRSDDGIDLARSFRSRLVVESTWLPSAFHPSLGAVWADGGRATLPVGGHRIDADLEIGPGGALTGLRLLRWTDLDGDGRLCQVAFHARPEAERTFGGYTIPSELRAGWYPESGPAFDFFHAVVEDARFLP